MEVNVYEYLVNPYSLQGIKNITEVPKGKDFSIVCDCTTEIFMVLYQMAQDHTILVTVPGHTCLYDILNICRKDSKVDIELKSTYYEMSDSFVQELIEVRCVGDYYKPKITAERNDDGSVTFSVPTLQGVTLKQRVLPALSHGDEPGERGEQGDMNNEAVRFFSDVIGPFTSDSWQSPHSAIVKSLKTEKAIKFVDSWFAQKPPRKSLFILKEGSNDVFILTEVFIEAKEYGVITFEFSYYGNIMNSNVSLSIPTAVGKRGSLPFQNGMLTYTDVADDGSKDGNVFMFCRGGRGNGKPIFDPSNPEHRSIIMQGLREMMMPIEDKYPQLHRARLNKPKSI